MASFFRRMARVQATTAMSLRSEGGSVFDLAASARRRSGSFSVRTTLASESKCGRVAAYSGVPESYSDLPAGMGAHAGGVGGEARGELEEFGEIRGELHAECEKFVSCGDGHGGSLLGEQLVEIVASAVAISRLLLKTEAMKGEGEVRRRVWADFGNGGEERRKSRLFRVGLREGRDEPGQGFRFVPAQQGMVVAFAAGVAEGENPVGHVGASEARGFIDGGAFLRGFSFGCWSDCDCLCKNRMIEEPEIVGYILIERFRRGATLERSFQFVEAILTVEADADEAE